MTETKPVVIPTLQPGRFLPAETVRNLHCATGEMGVTIEQMLHPDYWAHEARKMRPRDLVELSTEDGTFWALAMVLSCGRNWAKLVKLQYVPLVTADVEQTDAKLVDTNAYRIEWKGPAKKHVVIRKSDNEIINEGIASKAEAQAWVADHIKQTA